MKATHPATFGTVALLLATTTLIAAAILATTTSANPGVLITDVLAAFVKALVGTCALSVVYARQAASALRGATLASAAMLAPGILVAMVGPLAVPASMGLLALGLVGELGLFNILLAGVVAGITVRLDASSVALAPLMLALLVLRGRLAPINATFLLCCVAAALLWAFAEGDLLWPQRASIAAAIGAFSTSGGLGLALTAAALLILEPRILRQHLTIALLALGFVVALATHNLALATVAVAMLAAHLLREVAKTRGTQLAWFASAIVVLPAIPSAIGLGRGVIAIAQSLAEFWLGADG